MKRISQNAAATQTFGKQLAKKLRGGEIIALHGDLGAGKTTLVKGLAAGLGVTQHITSPTFLLMRGYEIANSKGQIANSRGQRAKGSIKRLIHIDCYRIKSANEIKDIGALEYFGRPDTVVVVEWAEKIKKILPRQIKKITLGLGKSIDQRIISYSP